VVDITFHFREEVVKVIVRDYKGRELSKYT